jgi:gamma-glutamylcyclotransferase (GGCT)/AIG2-like uncharacterized protein YtfP
MTTLFIYGTLKRGQSAHHLLAGQAFLGDAITEPRYRIVDLGPHPALIADDIDGVFVHGELWTVDDACLEMLNDYEGAPTYYHVQPIRIQNRVDAVFTFMKTEPPAAGLPSGDRWPLDRRAPDS